MESCKPLYDYSLFIHRIRANLANGARPEQAVDIAVDQCLKEDILTDVLRVNRREVVQMFLEEYDEELHEKTLREEGREEGRQMMELTRNLIWDNRLEELLKATEDEELRRNLIEEYGIDKQKKRI